MSELFLFAGLPLLLTVAVVVLFIGMRRLRARVAILEGRLQGVQRDLQQQKTAEAMHSAAVVEQQHTAPTAVVRPKVMVPEPPQEEELEFFEVPGRENGAYFSHRIDSGFNRNNIRWFTAFPCLTGR